MRIQLRLKREEAVSETIKEQVCIFIVWVILGSIFLVASLSIMLCCLSDMG